MNYYVCLDIEHWIKTYILRLTTNDSKEDGYHIVKEVINNQNDPEEFKNRLFSSEGHYEKGQFLVKSQYERDYAHPPLWTILEISSFGELRFFIEYLSKQQGASQDLKQINSFSSSVNCLRSKCAQ